MNETRASRADHKSSNQTADADSSTTEDAGQWWDYCPACGSRLRNRGCKYVCPTCSYFMSCSDYDQ